MIVRWMHQYCFCQRSQILDALTCSSLFAGFALIECARRIDRRQNCWANPYWLGTRLAAGLSDTEVLLSLFATLPADFVGCRGCLEMDNFIMPFMGHALTLTRVVQNPQPSLDREPAGGRPGTVANGELTASC
jgi:hypothetical protein